MGLLNIETKKKTPQVVSTNTGLGKLLFYASGAEPVLNINMLNL